MNDISRKLRELCPSLTTLAAINRSNEKNYPELLEVMRCHSRSNAYLVQIFKAPLESPCGCVACQKGLWADFVMDPNLAASLPHDWQVPLPTPLPVDVGDSIHYMALEEARLHPFSDNHQPSIEQRATTKRKTTAKQLVAAHPRAIEIHGQDVANKLVHRHLARAVVRCADCGKPRVIYSASAPNRMVPPTIDDRVPTHEEVEECRIMAKQVLQDCCLSPTFLCGAPVLGPDHPMASVFQTQSTLSCSDPIEPFFYTCSGIARSNLNNRLCAICADQEGDIDDELKALFRTVLLVCTTCVSKGALIPVRYAARNAEARARQNMAERNERANSETSLDPTPSNQPQLAQPQPRAFGRGRGRGLGRGRGMRQNT